MKQAFKSEWKRELPSDGGGLNYYISKRFEFVTGTKFTLLALGIAAVFSLLGRASPSHLNDRCQTLKTSSINWTDSATVCLRHLDLSRFVDKSLRVVIDPGHGGKDRGAQGHFGISEKWLSLEVARLVRTELENFARGLGIPLLVKMTREEDAFLSLHERVSFANSWDADLFVSVHANWSVSSKARGFEVYFLSPEASDADTRRLVQTENKTEEIPIKSDILNILADVQNTLHIQESSLFAEFIYDQVSRRHSPSGKGVRQGPFTVLSGTAMPAVLLELGFLSNPQDAQNLKNQPYLRSLTSAISSGIIEFALRNRERHAS